MLAVINAFQENQSRLVALVLLADYPRHRPGWHSMAGGEQESRLECYQEFRLCIP